MFFYFNCQSNELLREFNELCCHQENTDIVSCDVTNTDFMCSNYIFMYIDVYSKPYGFGQVFHVIPKIVG